MKHIISLFLLTAISLSGFCQEKPYKPEANAKEDLKKAIEMAKYEDKHILVVVGGNWCPWCRLLDKYIKETGEVNKYIDEKYVMLKINYSKEQKNMDVMQELEFPNRFGFPVLLVLDENGKRIHTQNSAYLEEGKGYNGKTVMAFLRGWTKDALKPELYLKK